ncbi:PREDICTED: zinc finger CCCH domain-containing protein 6 [Tarenaya hassleriana]|uniref:zinc finger CCCH domain-containing protein 6 n=1 Tax=Tarenaya hassleriana TaxID=28532 RepID=UPI00053C34FF|nr:PREDICTED: zinc finger CCCH domain-containing protein 6 [Tarenaya hassleriana]
MRALHKSKRVSWPPDFKLCQVRLFLSEDSPSQVGSGAQDHLQAKSPLPSHPSDENLPPGFGGSHSADQSQINLSDIPMVQWKCSVRILLDADWRVVVGDESEEVEAQNQREIRVLEAFYPCASAIPPNPSISDDVENSHYDDQLTTIVPILPVEDDDVTVDAPSDFSDQFSVAVGTQQPLETNENASPAPTLPTGSEIMAALSEISRIKEQGHMIDQDLLLKILSNPKLVENLVASCGSGSVSSSNEANGVEPTIPANSNERVYLHPNGIDVASAGYPPNPPNHPNYGATQARDPSYYKNLIHQHGGERQEPLPVQHSAYGYNTHTGGGNHEMVNNSNPRPKHKIMKPCIYFNSSRGCRHGANCAYQHDTAAYQPRTQNNGNGNPYESINAKRMRFDRS